MGGIHLRNWSLILENVERKVKIPPSNLEGSKVKVRKKKKEKSFQVAGPLLQLQFGKNTNI